MAIRFLMYGGAKSKGDNSAFYYASLNVKKDYGVEANITIKPLFIDNGTHQIISEIIYSLLTFSVTAVSMGCFGVWGYLWIRV